MCHCLVAKLDGKLYCSQTISVCIPQPQKKSQVNKMSMNISYSVKTYNNEGSLENKTCNFSAGGFN